jgi:hypothetical protein
MQMMKVKMPSVGALKIKTMTFLGRYGPYMMMVIRVVQTVLSFTVLGLSAYSMVLRPPLLFGVMENLQTR